MGRSTQRDRRTWGPRNWISYDDETTALSNRRLHRIGVLPSGLLVIRRPRGSNWGRNDMEDLTPEEFQERLFDHTGVGGEWRPMRLYRIDWDPNYIRITYDPDPERRREWLVRRGLRAG